MQTELKDKAFSIEEYILLEEASEIRHEYINGYLYEMSGASDNHNLICQNLLFIFKTLLKSNGYFIFMESVKVKIPGEKIYYYPDIIVTNEARTSETRYIKFQPSILAEVTPDSTRKIDKGDKLINYQKIPSLKYYLIVEQDKEEAMLVSKNAQGNWQSETYNQSNATIKLPALEMQLSLKEIYAQ